MCWIRLVEALIGFVLTLNMGNKDGFFIVLFEVAVTIASVARIAELPKTKDFALFCGNQLLVDNSIGDVYPPTSSRRSTRVCSRS